MKNTQSGFAIESKPVSKENEAELNEKTRSEDVFDPQGLITRAEFATLLVNRLGLNDDVKGNYKDVERGTWYYDIVARAEMNGIDAGFSEGKFYLEKFISREGLTIHAKRYI